MNTSVESITNNKAIEDSRLGPTRAIHWEDVIVHLYNQTPYSNSISDCSVVSAGWLRTVLGSLWQMRLN